MPGVCLAAGAAAAFLATSEFTLAWHHSVERVRWEERYRVEGDRLALVEASVAGMGAGMEPGPSARLVGGRWIWHPTLPPQHEVRLAASAYSADYEICLGGRCTPLGSLLTANSALVTMRACDGAAAATSPLR